MEVTLWKNSSPDLEFTGMKGLLSSMQTLDTLPFIKHTQ